jgi:undecaprenyl-phosphate 4-deoxy-4-formamido-L-arabinose transferase
MIHGLVVQDFPFFAATIAIFSGVQLFTIGVIGEYIARIRSQSLGKPSYVVREAIGQDRNGEDE